MNKILFRFHCRHGKSKALTGVGLWAVGAATGNENLQQTGQALTGLGLLSKGVGLALGR